MERLLQDLRYSLYRLAKNPGFTLVALLTLALGIGANSAIFSVVDGVLLRPLPFDEPDRLLGVFTINRPDGSPTASSAPDFTDVRDQVGAFESAAAYRFDSRITLTGSGDPEQLAGLRVSADFFEVLGVRPALGRTFRPGENTPGNHLVAVLGHALWQRRFAGDPEVVGRTIRLDGEAVTVVGVMPPGIDFPNQREIWMPLAYSEQFTAAENRRAQFLGVIARLRDGVTEEQARLEVERLGQRLTTEYPQTNTNIDLTAYSLAEELFGDVRKPLLVLLGAVGLVLLIACVNVANLLLARAAGREPEMAVRTALGAQRPRLVRQLLTESIVLSLLGGGLGLLVAFWGTELLVSLQPEEVPRLDQVTVDATVVSFTLLLSLATGVVFGLIPALQGSRSDLVGALKEGGRSAMDGRGSSRLRSGLVVAEIALAAMLLVGAGLLIRSFRELQQVDPGFDPQGLLAFDLSLPSTAYPEDPQREQFYSQALERLRALPGVEAAGGVLGLPLSNLAFVITFEVEGRPPARPGEEPAMHVNVITPGYFETLGVPVVRGRDLRAGDGPGAPPVVLINEAAVRQFFPDQDPLGKRIILGWGRGDGEDTVRGDVVGVVGDTRKEGLHLPAEPEIYIPHRQVPVAPLTLVARIAGDPMALLPAARRQLQELDPNLPLDNPRTVEQMVYASSSQPRFYTLLLTVFAGIALLLAAVGTFGVMSYSVAQRTRELGIRIALGAEPGRLRQRVLGRALGLTLTGVAVGLAGALALTRLLASLLYEVSTTDLATFSVVAAVLAAVAVTASYLPARAATRVDPMVALRAE
ncbi:MAG TPA: ABC transporter permease [Thermoanaerobaculia bacterium]|nr:ABC transporter permease [Thermoanaerobaculia bacterium]